MTEDDSKKVVFLLSVVYFVLTAILFVLTIILYVMVVPHLNVLGGWLHGLFIVVIVVIGFWLGYIPSPLLANSPAVSWRWPLVRYFWDMGREVDTKATIHESLVFTMPVYGIDSAVWKKLMSASIESRRRVAAAA
jgi:hypothetical protein